MPSHSPSRPFHAAVYERIVTAHSNLRALSQSNEAIRIILRREAMKMGMPSLFMSAKSPAIIEPDDAANAAANNLEKLVVERHRISGILNFDAPKINYGLVLLGEDCAAFQLHHQLSPARSARLDAAIEAFVGVGMATSSFAGV